ncbi:MAG: ribulose 1,5-bisphosphate carboxylase [Alphaproteobacteria bacterium]|nr:ribulose 1,5-bisphosphate carboxylase [Alphaproteobacteria bacterium]
MNRIVALYHIDAPAREIEEQAQNLAVEQSVEMPLAAIRDPRILKDVVGRVEDIEPASEGGFHVRIGLALETMGADLGQLMNMLFGNASILDHVRLLDAEFPQALLARYLGPRFGIQGLRALLKAHDRPLTATAIKPQGLASDDLAGLCRTFARAGIDVIKDDHGMGDQSYAPFHKRVAACQKAVSTSRTLYAPHLTGGPKALAEQIKVIKGEGVGMAMLSPMLLGLALVQELVAELGVPVLAHPAMAGASRIAPSLLLGKLFRLAGADVVVYPNHGGRFGYSTGMCNDLALAARGALGELKPVIPVPAGGMTLKRVPEMVKFYGPDVMLLIGGGLLMAGDDLFEQSQAFVQAVAGKEMS